MDGASQDLHGPPPAEAASPETRLRGHLGHLTPQEDTAFDEFKTLAAKEGFYKPATDITKASHDDGTLMYAETWASSLTADLSQADICELGSSSLRKPTSNSKILRSGARTTTWMPCTRR